MLLQLILHERDVGNLGLVWVCLSPAYLSFCYEDGNEL